MDVFAFSENQSDAVFYLDLLKVHKRENFLTFDFWIVLFLVSYA
jgi:hypothetical protein